MKWEKSVNPIRQARKRRGFTQQEMADQLAVCRQTYQRYEQEPDAMPVGVAVRLAEIIGCPLERLTGEERELDTGKKRHL